MLYKLSRAENVTMSKGSRKKVLTLVARPLREGGGRKGPGHLEKRTFFEALKKLPPKMWPL